MSEQDEFFTSRPPEQEARQKYQVMRSSKKQKLKFQVLCLSDRLHCSPTHHAGRTVPCVQPFGRSCPSCNKGTAPRWVGYFAAWDGAKKVMVELTAGASDRFAKQAESQGSMRGMIIEVSRLGDRHNGELMVDWKHSNHKEEQIPECFDVRDALFRMWRVTEHIKKSDRVGQIPMEEFVNRGHAAESDQGGGGVPPDLNVTEHDGLGSCPKCNGILGWVDGIGDTCVNCNWHNQSEVA